MAVWKADYKKKKTEQNEIRYENTLLHKDKDLSTRRPFHKSVPGDKHLNTQYVKQQYK